MNLHTYPEIMMLEEVAEYLRANERTIANWANEGKIPAGKIGASWRFKREDIRRWVDSQLKSEAPVPDTSMSAVVSRERVFVSDLDGKSAVLNLLIDALAETPFVSSREALATAIFKRESLMSTGIGRQLAIPHVRLAEVNDLALAVSLNKRPIRDYESLDGKPVRLVAMIVAREDQHPAHLATLSCFSRILREPERYQAIMSADSPEALFSLLTGSQTRGK